MSAMAIAGEGLGRPGVKCPVADDSTRGGQCDDREGVNYPRGGVVVPGDDERGSSVIYGWRGDRQMCVSE